MPLSRDIPVPMDFRCLAPHCMDGVIARTRPAALGTSAPRRLRYNVGDVRATLPQARFWWRKAERLAGLEPKRGRGWHSLRRKFASDRMDLPLKVLCELGGWKAART